MRLVFTAEALAHLKDIGAWIQKDSPGRARTFIRELRATCNRLVHYPARFPVIARRDSARIRRCVHGDYLVLFDTDTVPGTLLILRVLHGARDYARLLGLSGPEEEPSSP